MIEIIYKKRLRKCLRTKFTWYIVLLPPYLSTLNSSSSLLYNRDLKHNMQGVATDMALYVYCYHTSGNEIRDGKKKKLEMMTS